MKTIIILSVLLFLVIVATEIYYKRKPFVSYRVTMLRSIEMGFVILLAFCLPREMSLGFIAARVLFIAFFLFVPYFLVRVFFGVWRRREIAIADFLGKGKHVYRSEIGFRREMMRDARMTGTYDLFRYYVGENLYDIVFFDTMTHLFYGIVHEKESLVARRCGRDSMVSPFIGKPGLSQIQKCGTIMGTYNDAQSIWNSFSCNGESLEQVLSRSYITYLD